MVDYRQKRLLHWGLFLARQSCKSHFKSNFPSSSQLTQTHKAAHLEYIAEQNHTITLSSAALLSASQPFSTYWMFSLFYLNSNKTKIKAADLFFFIEKKCYVLILMHSNITGKECRRGKILMGVCNTVSSSFCKSCHCQKHLGMLTTGNFLLVKMPKSKRFQVISELTRTTFLYQLLMLEILPKGVSSSLP